MTTLQDAATAPTTTAPNVRITDVEAVYLRMPDFDEARTDSSRDALIIRVSTDAGVTGYGEVDSSPP